MTANHRYWGTTLLNGGAAAQALAERAVLVIIFLYPVLLLSVRNGMSTCFVLLFLISLYYLARFDWRDVIVWRAGDIAFAAAMVSLMVATLISHAYHRTFELGTLDGPARFVFAVPIYLMLRQCPLSFPRVLEYGFPLGVLAALLTSIFFPSIYWVRAQGTYFVDPVMFGGAVLVLGLLSASTINWTRKDPLPVLALKLAGLVIGLACAIRSSERGVWIAIPVLLFLWARYRIPLKYGAPAAGLIIVVALATYWLNPLVHVRIVMTLAEMGALLGGDLSTSFGIRLQIWLAVLDITQQNPVVGVGPVSVLDSLRAYGGWFTESGLKAGLSQIHNEILADTLRLGILGLFSIVVIYLVPLVLFIKATESADQVKQTAGVMGTLFVTAYFIFGLTAETFNLKMFAAFYAGTVAVLLAVARHSTPFTARVGSHGA